MTNLTFCIDLFNIDCILLKHEFFTYLFEAVFRLHVHVAVALPLNLFEFRFNSPALFYSIVSHFIIMFLKLARFAVLFIMLSSVPV